jgi:hypothetical protein
MHASRIARFCLLVLSLFVLATPAQAATPRVLEVIPKDGPLAVVAVDNLERSDARLRELLTAVNGAGYAGIGALLGAMGVREGIDLSGSAAIVFLPMEGGGEGAAMPVALLPSRDPEAFFASVSARGEGDARTFEYSGAMYAARVVKPGYLVVGNDLASVESFKPAEQGASANITEFGPVGALIAGSSDLVAYADSTNFARIMNWIWSVFGAEAPLGSESLGGYFPDRLLQLLKSESRGVLLAASFDPGALRIDCASTFVADGVLNRAAQSPKDAGAPAESPLATMPALPYLLALGIDAAHPGVRILADELGPPGRSTKVFVQLELAILGAIPSMEALSLVVYEPASVMFGSLARTMFSWRAPAPEEGARAFREWVESLDQRPQGDKVFGSKYEPGAELDSWSITPPAGAFPMAPMLLGPFPDIQGKLGTKPGRAYLTWSRDAALMDRAAKVGLDGEPPLDRDELLSRVSSMLPKPRIIDAYFDTTPIIKQIGPMMAGRHAAAELPAKVSPLGAAVTAEQRVARLSIVAPTDLLKAWRTLSQSAADDEPSRPDRPTKKE